MNGSVHNETDQHGRPLPTDAPVDENILDGPPLTTWYGFKHHRLRQFPGHETQIKWLEYLGHGREGIVYKASIGNGDPVAIKVFWRSLRPNPIPLPRGGFRAIEWPFEDESRTIALTQKIKWVMSTNPEVKVRKGPKTYKDAVRNFYLFSDEGRQKSSHHGLADPPPFPPLPTCYGWMQIQRDQLPLLDHPVWYDIDGSVDWHWAIVFEFVPGAIQDFGIGQLHLDFFYTVGFALEAYKPDNWHGGRLIDYNDIFSPFTKGWRAVRQHDSSKWF